MSTSFRARARACFRAALALLSATLFALVTYGTAHAVDLLNGNEDFKLLASLGFEQAVDGAHPEGSRYNDYAWSMAWFRNRLYVGTGRFQIDPATGQPGAGQIWRYTPGGADGASGTWALVLQAPPFVVGGGAREFGYRWMTQCSFNGIDYLFVSTIGTVQGNILYTTDGVNFTPVPRAGYPANTVGFRTMVCFTEAGGRKMLITTPVGKAGDAATFDSDRSDNPIVLASSDPINGAWRNYSQMGMGDANNGAIFTMYGSPPWLYAGVNNEVTGAELWRTKGCGFAQAGCVPNWTRIIDRGGGRPPSSAGVVGNKGFSDMVAHNGSLYLALSSPALDLDLVRAELWRLRSDDTFEVLVGEARFDFGANGNAAPTNPAFPANLRCGVPVEDINASGGANDCPPTTRRGAGWGPKGTAATGYPNVPQFYFWRLFNYANVPGSAPKGDNRLYMGTFQGGTTQSLLGFDLFSSADGVDWLTVSSDGLGSWQQQGVRSLAASPYGLFIGGTHFLIGYTGEVRGASVWLGSPAADAVAPVTTLTTPPSPNEGDTLSTRTATFAWTGSDTPAGGSLPLTYAYRLDPIEPAFSAFGSATTKSYSSLLNGTYTFFVIAKDASGNTEAAGAAPGAANRRTFTISAPDLPPTVSITVAPSSPSTSANASFAWSGSDDVTPPASLTYDRWLSPPQADPGTFTPGTTASYTGLTDGSYTFHVIAKDGAGNVSTEATASFTVAIPPAPPSSPSPASAALIGPRMVRVTWANVASETGYNVERCLANRSCTYAPVASNLPADTTTYDDTITAANPAGPYSYRVRACNATGCSAWATAPNVNVP